MRITCWGILVILSLLGAGCGGSKDYRMPKPRPSDDSPPVATASTFPSGQTPSAQPSTASTSPATAAATSAATPSGQAAKGGSAAATASGTQLSERDRRVRVAAQLTQLGQAFAASRARDSSYPHRRAGALSWRVKLLLFLGHRDLYQKFRLNEPWDSPHNRKLLDQIPDVFKSPDRTDGKTNLVLITGPNTMYANADGTVADDCRDGPENTLLLVEVGDDRAVPWTAPEDYAWNRETLQQDLFSRHEDCCFALFADGTVRRISANIADHDLLALSTPAGGEAVKILEVTGTPAPDVDTKLIEELQAHPLVRFAPAPAGESVAAKAVGNSQQETPGAQTLVPEVGQATDAQASSPASAPDGRWAVPDNAALQQAAAMFREIYGDLYKTAKSLPERRALARKMFDQSGSLAADPAGMYVLLRAARDVAAQAGDVDTAFHAILEMAASYRVDPLPLQLKSLEQAGAVAQTTDEWQGICKHALRLGEQALAKDDFTHAQRLFALAQNIARRDNRREELIRLSRKLEELEQSRTAQRRISKHAYTLVQSPADSAANAAVGRYLCLVKGDWERGLARLVRGDDVTLRQLAQRELRPPATTDQQVDVADGWWDWADTATLRLELAHARRRAAHWYREALPKLSASFAKSRMEKRIAEAEDASLSAKPQPVASHRPTAG
ncbi:MAG: DUF1559 domain-containing protein [Planctomycetota bacterium]|nr:DUF1559 domain-containing protein [Planctomycetota bacterium]